MAVALRELERQHARRRPALRVVPPAPAPPRPPRAVFWLRRALVIGVVALLVAGAVVGVRTLTSAPPRPQLIEMTIVVPDGGTLWGLADRYAPSGADRAVWAADVAERNGIDPGGVRAGMALTVPVEAPVVSAVPRAPATR